MPKSAMQAWGVIALDAGVRTMQCPDCNGTGILKNVHHNMGDKPHYWADTKCFRCNGVGLVDDEMAQWVKEGQEIRKERQLRGEALWVTAERLGMTSAELSAIENGRKPMPKHLRIEF